MVCVPRPLTLTGHADTTLPNVGMPPDCDARLWATRSSRRRDEREESAQSQAWQAADSRRKLNNSGKMINDRTGHARHEDPVLPSRV
jgi:hypothetical protein